MEIVKLISSSCATQGVCAECGISSKEDPDMVRIVFMNGSICLCGMDFEKIKKKLNQMDL